VTVEAEEVVPFAIDAAVTDTAAGDGTFAGAVYTAHRVVPQVPAPIVPTVEFPFTIPFTFQVTAVSVGPVTVAVKL
jgi:hypothetical protein